LVRKLEKAGLSVTAGALGAFAALTLGASSAQADPDVPPPPGPVLPGPVLPGPADQSITTQAAAGDPAAAPVDPAAPPAPPVDPAAPPAPPTEVQHLSSPTNLPPGTTDVPLDPGQSRTGSYLRDLFHAYQTQEISGKDALLLLTQRPLDPNAMPTNGMPAGPQAPPGTPPPLGAPAPDAPPPADAPPPGPTLPGLAPPADAAPPAPVLPGLPPPTP
jgi:hypothetical protein